MHDVPLLLGGVSAEGPHSHRSFLLLGAGGAMHGMAGGMTMWIEHQIPLCLYLHV